jgi:hypothetical protein
MELESLVPPSQDPATRPYLVDDPTPLLPTSLTSILILTSNLWDYVGLPNGVFLQVFFLKRCISYRICTYE